MMGIWIGAIQNMYPELGAGVEEHSILLREPLQRVARSVYPIMGVVYDGDRAPKPAQIRATTHHQGVDATVGAITPSTPRRSTGHTFFMLIIKPRSTSAASLPRPRSVAVRTSTCSGIGCTGCMRPVPEHGRIPGVLGRKCSGTGDQPRDADIFSIRIPAVSC
jgi:hypothetical protein